MPPRYISNLRMFPISVQDVELFTIRIHYTIGSMESSMHYSIGCMENLVGYVDYCCADQMLRLELLSMAREFKIEVDGCNLCWFDVSNASKGLRETKKMTQML